MKNYACEKCGSMDVFIKQNGGQTGLYCGDCGKWIKWVGKSELPMVERFIEEQKKDIPVTYSTNTIIKDTVVLKQPDTENELIGLDNWSKLKCYLEGAISCEDDSKPYEKIYGYMLKLENKKTIE